MMNENLNKQELMLENGSTKNKLYSLLDPKYILILLPLLFVVAFAFIPMIKLFKLSFIDQNGFTLQYLSQVFTQKIYMQVILLTLKTGVIVTVLSIILSYPVAYFIVKTKSVRAKKVVLLIIMIPFWISLLVRTFSWIIILQDQGILNTLLIHIGLINKPLHLLYNTKSVTIGMVHVLFPFMVLNIYSSMENIDMQLVQVAQIMGAKPIKAFWQVFFPLSIPGILSGSILVFVLSLGYFITPSLLGGSQNMLISTLIQNNISATLNWPLAASLALVLFIITMALLIVLGLIMKKNHMMGDES
ncbi:ABC transporter permease [Clostridium tyrobutyricum]|uniref:ABC transporter permease n=1 Tax=Clostridium tyrobutyricum TaxID=1519 RepID=UPI002B21FBFB|nr:ABC transporter permease [Clostridium tyrobutyricum]MEA5009025.1 ABC transporter permease [Clostridium tyrobutyricum]